MKQDEKCPHGVYLAGEATARYCTGCNPTPQRLTTIKRHYRQRVDHTQDPELDCRQFMELPAGARMTAELQLD